MPDLQILNGDTTKVAQFAIVVNGRYYGGEFETAEDASLRSGGLAHLLAKKPLDRKMKSVSSQEVLAKSPGARGGRVPV